ncbi:hypothetical protein HYX70_02810 [Candidatus Saccharibacteria bacterium]|nr:hypothetical protein [Candidatus Saccharibacteria bacterium]
MTILQAVYEYKITITRGTRGTEANPDGQLIAGPDSLEETTRLFAELPAVKNHAYDSMDVLRLFCRATGGGRHSLWYLVEPEKVVRFSSVDSWIHDNLPTLAGSPAEQKARQELQQLVDTVV